MNLSSIGSHRVAWRHIPYQFLSLAAGLTVAATAAVSMGALGKAENVQTPLATPTAVAWSSPAVQSPLVYYIVGSEAEGRAIQDDYLRADYEIAQQGGVPSSVSRVVRVVDTPEDQELLLREFGWLNLDQIEYRVIDMR